MQPSRAFFGSCPGKQLAGHYNMLRSFPTNFAEGMNAYFDTINSKLTAYENLLSEAPILFPQQLGLDYGIVLNVPSYF